MELNLQNVEEVIFVDKRVHRLLPAYQNLFDSWSLGTRVTALRNLARRSVMDFLNLLQYEDIVKLSEFFGESVTVNKLHYHIVTNIDTTLESAADELMECEDYLDLTVCRKGDCLYISLWK